MSRKLVPHGSSNPSAKAERYAKILKLAGPPNNCTTEQIATRLNINKTTVTRVLREARTANEGSRESP